MKKLFYICLALAVAVPVQLTAQRTQPLTLDRIFASPEFAPQRFGPARWLEDGSYTTVEPSPAVNGAVEIVRYDARSGRREVKVSAAQLTPPTQTTPMLIEDYSWSADGDRLLIFTNSRRVWRQNTRGDYWVLDVGIGRLRQLGGDAPESTLMFAKFSPDGDRVGYVRQNNVYVEDLTSGRITQLTHDGSTTIINGTFDWVYEEEFSLRDGFRWSPGRDADRVLAARRRPATLKVPVARSSSSRIMNSARSRTSMYCTGSSSFPGTNTSPPQRILMGLTSHRTKVYVYFNMNVRFCALGTAVLD